MNAVSIQKIGHKFYKYNVPLIPRLTYYINFLLFNSILPPSIEIGKGTKLAYGGIGVVLHKKSEIGNNVIIGQGVTLGRKLKPGYAPKIGNNVYIAAGSKLLGDIRIGDNVIIGANSVVTKDVPANVIIAGAPATIVRNIDKSIYEIMEMESNEK